MVYLKMGTCNYPLQELKGGWVQPLGAVVSGIVWVTNGRYDWSMVFNATVNKS